MRDADRPPVLAHERFLDNRAALAGLSLAARFGVIHDTNLWGATSASGLGSEVSATVVLQSELPRLLQELQVRDARQLSNSVDYSKSPDCAVAAADCRL